MNVRDLVLRMRALAASHRVERELDEELAFHIEREAQRHIADGLRAAEALTRARTRFGSVSLAADECRDARGTAIVDDLARDILYAFRSFLRAPLTTLTIIATVGLGLGLITVVFTVYNTFFLRRDAVRNPTELFGVRPAPAPTARTWISFTRPRYEALRRETNVLTDAVAMVRDVRTRIDGRPLRSTLVTGNFFRVLGVDAALGRTLIPADDDPSAGRSVMVLSHRGWHRLFADDPTAIGQDVRVNGLPFMIVGIMPENFRFVSPEYFKVLGIEVVRGRGFMATERTPDAGVVIVSEQTARRLWTNRDPVGRIVRLQASQPSGPGQPDAAPPQPRAYTVIGVVRDVTTHP